jgi:hypothetical protein
VGRRRHDRDAAAFLLADIVASRTSARRSRSRTTSTLTSNMRCDIERILRTSNSTRWTATGFSSRSRPTNAAAGMRAKAAIGQRDARGRLIDCRLQACAEAGIWLAGEVRGFQSLWGRDRIDSTGRKVALASMCVENDNSTGRTGLLEATISFA